MLLLGIALLPLILLMVLNHLRFREEQVEKTRHHLLSVSLLLAKNQETAMQSTSTFLELLATKDYVRGLDVVRAEDSFKVIIANSPQLANIGLATPDGAVIASSLPQPPNSNISDRSWFQAALQSRKITAGEYRIGRVTRQPVIVFACPVLDDAGSPVGVVFASIYMATLEKELKATALPSEVRLTLFSLDGRIFVNFPWSPGEEEANENANENAAPLVQAVKKNPGGEAEITELDGVRRLYGFRQIAESVGPSRLFLAVSLPLEAVTLPATRAFWRDIGIMALVVVGTLVLAWLICSRLLLHRINRLVGVTRQLGEGNLEAQVPVEKDHDEIGQLDEAFNAMARRLKSRDEEVHQKQAEILETKLQLLQSQKMELLGRLAGGLAHDLKNILMVMGGSANILESDAKDEETRRLANQITTASENAGMMIAHLLAFSRNQSVETKSVDLNEIIVQGNGLIQHLVGRRVHITLQLDPAISQIVAAPSQITQIVLNLAINARDAMPQGGTLTIQTLPVQKQSILPDPPQIEGVVLRVSDTGHGIDPAIVGKIFDPFFTTKPDSRGTGLGLSSVQTIVRTLGGSIEIASQPGHGATFEIFFPAIPLTD